MKKKTLVLVLITTIFVLSCVIWLWQREDVFSSSKWINCKDESDRFKMINDLEKRYGIIGMTSDEIIELLGKPECKFDINQFVYNDFEQMGADEYWYYRVKDDWQVGWKIYLIGFNDRIVVGKKLTVEDW